MKTLLILGGFLLGATFFAPAAAAESNHDRRYYHREGRDYHVYNSQEDRAYRIYLGEQRRTYREFHVVKRTQQQQYFKWRHQHPDKALFKIEVK